MLRRADEVIDDIFARHLRPRLRMTADEWADRYRVVAEPSPRPGRWRTGDVPFMRDMLRDYTDPAVRRVVLMCAPQVCKTEYLINCLFYSVDRDPYPSLWIMHSQDKVREFAGDRLMDQVRATPAVARHLSARKWDTKRESIRFDSMTVYFAGANSAGNLASKPAGRVFFDELDKAPSSLKGRGAPDAGARDLASARLGAFGDFGKMIEASSPTVEGIGIAAQYAASDQAEYFIPCPRCGKHQRLRFGRDAGVGGLRWDPPSRAPGMRSDSRDHSGGGLSDDAAAVYAEFARRTAWYECAHCGGRIESHEKPSILAGGLWVRAGQEVRDGKVVGEAPDTGTRGYHLSRLAAPWYAFGETAEAWIRGRGEITQAFVNEWLGEPWKLPGARGEESIILAEAARQRESIEVAALANDPAEHPDARTARERTIGERYRKGEVPGAGLVLIGGIDVQQEGVYSMVAALGEAEAVFLIDWRFINCPENAAEGEAAWGLVEHFMRRDWPRVDTGEAVPVHTWHIDSGYRTHEVYRLALRMGPWVRAVKGQEQALAPVSWGKVDVLGAQGIGRKTEGGRRQPDPGGIVGQLDLMSIRTGYFKDDLLARLHRRPPQNGAVRYPIDMDAEGSDGHALARHLTAEERVKQRLGRRDVFTWRPRPGRADNHWGDCLVYILAGAESLGARTLTRGDAAPVNPLRPAERPGSTPAPRAGRGLRTKR